MHVAALDGGITSHTLRTEDEGEKRTVFFSRDSAWRISFMFKMETNCVKEAAIDFNYFILFF